jgi:hypothetical protein
MSRKQYSPTERLAVAVALALAASGVALADDSSMSRFGGDSYAYFNRSAVGTTPANPAWRQSHANGLTERELQALSSSDLSVFTAQLNPQVFAGAPTDPSWRASHPNGLTERELQALSSSSLAIWQAPSGPGVVTGRTNVAERPSRGTFAAQSTNFFAP